MDWGNFLAALALMLVIEGLLPFINPPAMRKAWLMLGQLDDKALRIGGLASMGVGLVLLYLVH